MGIRGFAGAAAKHYTTLRRGVAKGEYLDVCMRLCERAEKKARTWAGTLGRFVIATLSIITIPTITDRLVTQKSERAVDLDKKYNKRITQPE